MNTRQQIIWGAVVVVVVWFMLQEEPNEVPVKAVKPATRDR